MLVAGSTLLVDGSCLAHGLVTQRQVQAMGDWDSPEMCERYIRSLDALAPEQRAAELAAAAPSSPAAARRGSGLVGAASGAAATASRSEGEVVLDMAAFGEW